jgi:RNA polymerase sigma-70 factor (ECF subfamily)
MGATLWRIASEDELVACYDATVTDLFRYACRLVGDRAAAEDLVSDAYLALLRAAQDGSVDAVTIGWLITVVRRRHLDRLRSTAREERRLRLVQAPGGGAAPVDPGEISAKVAALSDRERTAITLRYVDDLPVADVADEMGISVHAAESLLARARSRIRDAEVRDA